METIVSSAAKQLVISNDRQVEFNNNVIADLGQSVNPVVTYKLSLLESAGYKYSSFAFGRNIDRKHCLALYKALVRKNKTHFTKRAVAMSAKVILEANQEVEMKDRIRLYDFDGNELSLETPGLDKYLVYLDGNHRWFVHYQHPEIDLEVELAIVSDPFEFMADYNCLSANWSLKDWIHAQKATGRIDGSVHDQADYVENMLGVSMKYANYLLTRTRECVKKSDLERGRDTTISSPAFTKRGMILARTIAALFPKPGKDSAEMDKVIYKGTRTLQFVDAIEYVDMSHCSNEFASNFSAFLCNLTENDRQVIYRYFAEKDYAALNQTLEKTYSSFLKSHESDLQNLIKASEEETLQVLTKPADTTKPQVLNSGTAKQIDDSCKAVAAYEAAEKAEKTTQKAADTAQKVFDKAQETLLNAEKNLESSTGTKKEAKAEEKLKEAQKAFDTAQEVLKNSTVLHEEAKTKFEALMVA